MNPPVKKSLQEYNELTKKTSKILLYLRLKAKNQMKKIEGTIKKPYLFYAHEYNGMQPVFIFSSFPCRRYLQGFCTPCSYSTVVHSSLDKDVIYSSLITQEKYIIKNFDKLVTNKQKDIKNKNLYYKYPNKRMVSLELCGEGSFLDKMEIPKEFREKILELLYDYSRKNKTNIHIFMEAKPADFLETYKDFESKKQEIKDYNMTLLFGFESADEFSRNVLYNKGIKLSNFEKAIKEAKRLGFRVGAFLFTAFHSMTQKELIDDVKKSIEYFRKKGVVIYFMISNLQPYTLVDLIYKYDPKELLDPRTIVEMIKFLIDHPKSNKGSYYCNGFNWSIGGLTTYPEPQMFLFSEPKKISCDKCSKIMAKAVYDLAINYDVKKFNEDIKPTDSCKCKNEYDKFVLNEKKTRGKLIDRVIKNLELAEEKKEDYIRMMELKDQAFLGERK